MKKIPQVSIILPNYNSHKFIRKTIRSVINQNFYSWELIIVDDASNEKTKIVLQRIQRYKKIRIYWLSKNKGAGYCRNLAIKKSKSKYIAFIDSDDIWKKNKLKNQINFMKKNNYSFTYTNYETFGKKKKIIFSPKKFNFFDFIHNTSICTSSMIIERHIAKDVKFTNTKICEDYFYKCGVLKKTKYAYCLNQILTKYQIRDNSLQKNYLKNFYWIWIINKNFNKLNFLNNLKSLFFISLNSLKKYGLK